MVALSIYQERLMHHNLTNAAQNAAQHFQHLQQQPEPLLLPNIWDPASAVLAQSSGAKALATSSAALAWALGYRDGEQLPLAELQSALQRILRVCRVPLSVDLEQGYSADPLQVASLVGQLAKMGVAGVNLEDGAGPAELLAAKISQCRHQLCGSAFFINARTDVYLRGLAQGDAAIALCHQRGLLYQSAGADALFIPGLNTLGSIQQIKAALQIPISLMGWPAGASVQQLHAAGICRVSAGPAIFIAGANATQAMLMQFLQQSHQTPHQLQPLLDYGRLDSLF
jgi:2-methylisocitrate lyase-like PEP mutase family enzyme